MTKDDETMVRILAEARAEALRTSGDEQVAFASKFLCLLFDPAKAAFPAHQPRAEALRRTFQGIGTSQSLQATFRESLMPALLAAPTLRDALEIPFDTLVRALSLEEDG